MGNGSKDAVMSDMDMVYGVRRQLTANTYTMSGYEFDYWIDTNGNR